MGIPGLLLLFLVVAAIAAAGRALARDGKRRSRGAPQAGESFRAEPLLVNPSERSAFDLLRQTDLGQAHVFAKVRLEDVASAHGSDRSTRSAARGRVMSRHVDFLLTDAAFRPILVVEVDGPSHRGGRSADSDAAKDRILAAAGIPLLRLRVGANWHAVLNQWRQSQLGSRATETSDRP